MKHPELLQLQNRRRVACDSKLAECQCGQGQIKKLKGVIYLMPIPRMTAEEKELEKQYQMRCKLARIPKHKRWLVTLLINSLIAWERIEKIIFWKG